MTEDSLQPTERRRLEALARAVAFHASRVSIEATSADDVAVTAERFDMFLRGSTNAEVA